MREETQRELQNFCYNVRRCRERLGISQQELSKASGVSLPAIQKLERGEFPKKMGVDKLLSLSDFFQKHPAQMLRERIQDAGD